MRFDQTMTQKIEVFRVVSAKSRALTERLYFLLRIPKLTESPHCKKAENRMFTFPTLGHGECSLIRFITVYFSEKTTLLSTPLSTPLCLIFSDFSNFYMYRRKTNLASKL